MGIASKHPLEGATVFAQSPHRMPAVQATAVRGRERLSVVCVLQQADELAKRLAARPGRVMLLGDFNESDDDAAVKRLRDAGFAVACDIDGERCGAT